MMKIKHTPRPWHVNHLEVVKTSVHAQRGHVATVSAGTMVEVSPDEQEANAKLIAAAPDLLAEIEATNAFALELMERAAKIDRMLLEAKQQPFECELGEIVRLRQQLERNREAITKATA